jgi:hypothetical protein
MPVKGLPKLCRSKKVQVSRRREAINGYQVIKEGGVTFGIKKQAGQGGRIGSYSTDG